MGPRYAWCPVQFPHGLLNMTKWRNWQTRDAQNVVPFGLGSSNLPLVTDGLQARQVPNWLSYGRCARFDTGACNLRVGAGSTGPHTPGTPGATPGPATTEYANWHSGEVESLVPVGSSPTSVTDKITIPWSKGKDAWATTRKVLVRFQPGSLMRNGL